MNKPMNTTYTFEFFDGETVDTTLTFYALYQLKNKKVGLYNRYNAAMNRTQKGTIDELDTITILYVAYVCANIDKDDLMSEEDFMIRCGSDRIAIANAVRALTQPKNSKASVNRS